jgi:hypothetical protein
VRSLPQLANEDNSRDSKEQNDDQTDQRRRSALVSSSIIAILELVIHGSIMALPSDALEQIVLPEIGDNQRGGCR